MGPYPDTRWIWKRAHAAGVPIGIQGFGLVSVHRNLQRVVARIPIDAQRAHISRPERRR